MAVLFKIEFVSTADDHPVMAELLEKEKNFWVTKNMRLGGIALEEWFSTPRAFDSEGNLRFDLFVFEIKKGQDKHQLKPGDIVSLLPGDELEFLLPWQACTSEHAALQHELYLELSEKHPLFGKNATTVARRIDNDDVLFKLDGEQYAVVHLTWSSKKERYPDCPFTRMFDHWKDVYEKVILEDHKDYVL